MLVMACINIAKSAVKTATSTLILPVSDKVTANAAITGETATPKVFGRMANSQAAGEPGLMSSRFTIRAPL